MGANGDETNGHGGDGGDGGADSNEFRTPADYEALGRLQVDFDDLGQVYERLGRGISATGGGVASLERDQVEESLGRWRRVRAEADELFEELAAEAIRLTARPILVPPWTW